jgi:hypothetical protein
MEIFCRIIFATLRHMPLLRRALQEQARGRGLSFPWGVLPWGGAWNERIMRFGTQKVKDFCGFPTHPSPPRHLTPRARRPTRPPYPSTPSTASSMPPLQHHGTRLRPATTNAPLHLPIRTILHYALSGYFGICLLLPFRPLCCDCFLLRFRPVAILSGSGGGSLPERRALQEQARGRGLNLLGAGCF